MKLDISSHALESVVITGEELNLARAAARLGITAGALRQSILEVEAKLDYALFKRGSTGLRLTGNGAHFLLEARRRLVLAIQNDTSAMEERPLLLGYSPHVNPELLSSMRRLHRLPGREWREVSVASVEQIQLVRDGLLDAGLVLFPLAAVGVRVTPNFCELLMVALPRQHPLAMGMGPLNPRELRDLPMIGLASSLHLHILERMLQICRQHGFEPVIRHEAFHMSEAIALVGEGEGFCFARECDRRFARESVVFRTLSGKPEAIFTGIVCRADSQLRMLNELAPRATRRTPHR